MTDEPIIQQLLTRLKNAEDRIQILESQMKNISHIADPRSVRIRDPAQTRIDGFRSNV
tara:strand:+ start:228 stop:401 length:174 start_codon:yes stop_codon:yes gene_type:complete